MQAGRGTQPSAEFQSFIEQWLSDDVEDANAGDSETTGFGVEQYPHVSAATPPTCSRRCRICSNQYKALEGRVLDPYARKYNDLDAQESVNEYIRTTEQNLDYVRSSLEAYGNAIHKRWLRRSPDKRAGLLQKAMPEMFTDKRHVARIVLTAGLSANPSALLEAARKAWLLQYLTVEDLSQDYTKLLALMHVRTSYTPSQWISFEFDSQRNAFDYDGIGLCYNPHCVVVGDKDFGRLIQWDREKAHGLEMIGFPLAHLTFEAQKDLSAFLRDMMDMLLGETGQQTPRGCDRWDATVQAGFDTSNSGVLARFANSYGPFSPPCRFDTDRIASLIHGRCAAAGDTLWLLQRDLLSFREFIATAQDTTYHQSLPDSKKLDDLVRHTLQAVSHVDHAVRDLKQARTTLDILRQHESRRALGELPRQEYKDALGLLHGMLAVEFQTQADGLYNIIKHASAFLQHFDTDWKGESNWQTTASQALRVDILYWNTMSLSTPNDLRSHGRAFHFAYIDDFLAKASRKERERVNQTIHDHLSDMAATYEALVIVGSHRPHIAALPEGDINKLMAKYGMDCTEVMLDELLASWDKAEEQLREPLRELLALPLPSVRVNSQSLARTERLHEAMRVFWQTAGVVRADGLQRQGLSRNDAMMRVSHLCVSETKAYKKAKAAELDAIRGAIELKGEVHPAGCKVSR